MDLTNSRDIIFEYAQLDEVDREYLGGMIDTYIGIIASDDVGSETGRRIRKEFVPYFIDLYKAIFFKTLESKERLPMQALMFLMFGFIDERLAGTDNANALVDIARTIGKDNNGHIFTLYQWLVFIYMGKKENSINEFSLDYQMYLRALRKNGEIDEYEERELLANPRKRVEYEIDNMLKTTDRMMLSQATLFSPFFDSHSMYKPIEQTVVRFSDIYKRLDKIRELDFSLFYRETLYVNKEAGIEKEFIEVEVLPDIILLPAIGDRGVMWQEITGAKRSTPGRFVLPLFQLEDLEKVLIKVCGEFRWDLCKRMQGARWNDLTEKSLTSEYCAYLDGYRKNHELSTDAREKVRNSLIRHRQSYREVFADDYLTYLQHEVRKSLKLNKVARQIIFTYCPFSEKYRKELSAHPLYAKPIEAFGKKMMHRMQLCEVSYDRHVKSGHTITKELLQYKEFLKM